MPSHISTLFHHPSSLGVHSLLISNVNILKLQDEIFPPVVKTKVGKGLPNFYGRNVLNQKNPMISSWFCCCRNCPLLQIFCGDILIGEAVFFIWTVGKHDHFKSLYELFAWLYCCSVTPAEGTEDNWEGWNCSTSSRPVPGFIHFINQTITISFLDKLHGIVFLASFGLSCCIKNPQNHHIDMLSQNCFDTILPLLVILATKISLTNWSGVQQVGW